jgi:hypothetical protein
VRINKLCVISGECFKQFLDGLKHTCIDAPLIFIGQISELAGKGEVDPNPSLTHRIFYRTISAIYHHEKPAVALHLLNFINIPVF